MPSVMTWRLVSSPPIRISRLSWMIDSSSSRSPSISASHRMLTRSSCGGSARRSAMTPSWNSRNASIASMPAWRTSGGGSAVVARIRSSDQRNRSSYDSGGKPSMSAMSSSGSGAAMSQTKSHSPFGATRSMISVQMRRIVASWSRTRRGVKPRLTSLRRRRVLGIVHRDHHREVVAVRARRACGSRTSRGSFSTASTSS